MSIKDSSSVPEIQPAINEFTEDSTTPILNQGVKDDAITTSDNHGKASLPQIQLAHESNQKATSKNLHTDVNNSRLITTNAATNENPSAPVFAATDHESSQPATTQILDSVPDTAVMKLASGNHGKSSVPEIQPAINEFTEDSTTQILNQDVKDDAITTSDNHGKTSLPQIQFAHESNQTATSDLNNSNLTPTNATTNENPSAPVFAATTHESSQPATTQILDSVPDTDAMKVASGNHGKSSSFKVQPTIDDDSPEYSATQIQDGTVISTHDHGNSSSAEVTTDSTAKSTTTKPETEDVAPASIDNHDSSTTEIQPATDPPAQTVGPDQDRKHLVNLIDQELKFVEKNYPKLGKHQEHIKKEAQGALGLFSKLKDEPCELKELKDLKKTVTKLKLQIPAKYRNYDESEEQTNQQYDGFTDKGVIPSKLLKRMPQLHNKVFHNAPFCKTIQQRYNKLKPELQLCLLCFSVFPENAIISRRLMVYWWIGEGLVPPVPRDAETEGDIETKTAEELANEFFNELIDKDFIEPVSKRHGSNIAICKMHPLIRAALVMIADEVKFFDFDEYGNPKDFGKFDEIESPEEMPVIYPLGNPREFFDFFDEDRQETTDPIAFFDPKGNPTKFANIEQDLNTTPPVDRDGKPIETSEKYYFYRRKKITTRSYRVCLMGSGLSKGIPWEKLHVLFNVKDDILEFKPEWFLRMNNVNVVFLGRWQSSATHHIEVDDFDFAESLDNMNHLKFFSLQGVSRISELPKSISKLENLLILDLRACHNLETIPKTIGSLKCLTHLDMSECYLLDHMPKEISYLESLQVLKGFVVGDIRARSTCTLFDLIKLPNLMKFSMYTRMKDFPREDHLEALQKFPALRKLTIAWGGHATQVKTDESKPNSVQKDNFASKILKFVPKKQWVRGRMRRMNAFNSSTLGARLQKLDLKCFPENKTPNWLMPGNLVGLKKLYIRGGQFSDLGQFQDIYDWDKMPVPTIEKWNVEVLRLKYLDELEMDWRELHNLFPKLTSLEKVKCPKLTLFPCNASGVWTKKITPSN